MIRTEARPCSAYWNGETWWSRPSTLLELAHSIYIWLYWLLTDQRSVLIYAFLRLSARTSGSVDMTYSGGAANFFTAETWWKGLTMGRSRLHFLSKRRLCPGRSSLTAWNRSGSYHYRHPRGRDWGEFSGHLRELYQSNHSPRHKLRQILQRTYALSSTSSKIFDYS